MKWYYVRFWDTGTWMFGRFISFHQRNDNISCIKIQHGHRLLAEVSWMNVAQSTSQVITHPNCDSGLAKSPLKTGYDSVIICIVIMHVIIQTCCNLGRTILVKLVARWDWQRHLTFSDHNDNTALYKLSNSLFNSFYGHQRLTCRNNKSICWEAYIQNDKHSANDYIKRTVRTYVKSRFITPMIFY